MNLRSEKNLKQKTNKVDRNYTKYVISNSSKITEIH